MIITAMVVTMGTMELSEKALSINEKVVTTERLINATAQAAKKRHKHSDEGMIEMWSVLKTIKSPGLNIQSPKPKANPPNQITRSKV